MNFGPETHGYIPVEDDESLDTGVSQWADLAAAAKRELDREDRSTKRVTYIHDGSHWRLAWFVKVDGKVLITNWFKENQPDPERFLGRPLFEEPKESNDP